MQDLVENLNIWKQLDECIFNFSYLKLFSDTVFCKYFQKWIK